MPNSRRSDRPEAGTHAARGTGHGCVNEVAIIVAGLSMQDPRIRPTESAAAPPPALRSTLATPIRTPISCVAAAVGPHQGRTQRTRQQQLPHNVSQRVPALPADSGVGGRPSPALRHRHRLGLPFNRNWQRLMPFTRRCCRAARPGRVLHSEKRVYRAPQCPFRPGRWFGAQEAHTDLIMAAELVEGTSPPT